MLILIIIQSYVRIDFSEGLDIDKTSASKEFNICHY